MPIYVFTRLCRLKSLCKELVLSSCCSCKITTLPKVIWEQAASVHALSHSHNSPLVTIGSPTLAPILWPIITPCRGPIRKPNYLSQFLDPSDLPFQTASISDQPFCHNALDRQTHTETNKWLEEMFNDYRPFSLYREPKISSVFYVVYFHVLHLLINLIYCLIT